MRTSRVQATLLTLLALLLTVSVACGGGDNDDDADGGGNDSAAATEQPRGSADGGSDDGDDDNNEIDFGDGLVVVTIGDDRFEFDMTEGFNVCRNVFGGIQFAGAGTDGRPTKVSGWIPPANWETFDDDRFDPPGIELDNDDGNSQWIADAKDAEFRGIAAGSSQVDSFEIDGLRASGTATFIDTFALGDSKPVVEGTFEIACEE